MRSLFSATMLLVAASLQTHAQGLVYDQQSTNPPSTLGDYLDIQPEPLTQSFIPALSAIGFVQFEFWDIPNNGNNGATVYVNLWTGSPNINSATLLGSTTPVYMPESFGEASPGVAIFYYSTLIPLTAGQTYYLQPVVQSGDNPWDVWNPGNTYPNGQLFVNGSGFNTDLWFREGVVPEPSTLALIGLSCILAYTFKRRSKLVVLLLFTVPVLSVHAAPDSVVQATAAEAGLTPVSATALPRAGTFWVITTSPNGHLTTLPYPVLPDDLSALPIFSVAGNAFIVDDTGGQLAPSSTERMSSAQATSTAQAQAETMAGLIDLIQTSTNGGNQLFQPNGLTVDTNETWLAASNEAPNLGLRLWNPVSGDDYQLLSTTNLLNTNWDLGQILFYASSGYADFTPVPMTNTMTFYRAHHANPAMAIYDGQDSEEFNPTNTGEPGHAGYIYIQDEVSATNDVMVYYSIGGTAQNGMDYSNLTGVVIVSNSLNYAEIDIDPIEVGLNPDKTIILTLLQNTNYLIDPAYYSATNNLKANPEVVPTVRGDRERLCPNTTNTFDLSSDASDPRDPSLLSLTYSILTWPSHGTLITNAMPPNFYATYTPTNCYEGQDSFTFKVRDGQYDSAPATVTLIISDPVTATPPTVETCRGTTSQPFTLGGSDNCNESLSYALLSNPTNGSLSGALPNLTYTPSNTNFTGMDSFAYKVSNECGDSATATVNITVGDASLQPNSQSVLTGTNEQVSITLTASDYSDACNVDSNYFTYTITSNPTNGVLSGTPPHLTYTPTNGEGMDSFQFNVSDGALSSMFPATVTLYVVAGPILTTECNPFGTAPLLRWSLDDTVNALWQDNYYLVEFFIVSRATNSGGPYTPIYTNDIYVTGQMSYLDTNAVVGHTNYYVVRFESSPYFSSVTYKSPLSNEIKAAGQNPDDLIPANAVWNVVTNLSDPTNVVRLKAPFSSEYPNQYPGLYPWPNSYWPAATNGIYSIWSNHITLFIPTNAVDLSQVQYSIAIDNDYWLYLNNSTNYIDFASHEDYATWSSFQAFDSVAPGILHYGTNDIVVVIQDRGALDYFSMVVTTNTCGF